jgi:ribonuclease P protein component
VAFLMPSVDRSGIQWISSPRDFKSLRRIGTFFRGGFIFVWVSPKASLREEAPSVGVVTGSGFRNAVRRNRARRRVRGCLVELRHLLKPGRSYLVECRPGAEIVDYQFLADEMQSILSRAANCMTTNEMNTGGER